MHLYLILGKVLLVYDVYHHRHHHTMYTLPTAPCIHRLSWVLGPVTIKPCVLMVEIREATQSCCYMDESGLCPLIAVQR